MRDVILSGTAGFLFACVGGFSVHRSVWKSADEQAKRLDAIVGNTQIPISTRGTESFESFIARRFCQWWNNGVDNVHRRLLNFPQTVGRIVTDVRARAPKPAESPDSSQ
ncbi:hypothetical protein BWQ96_01903 [Gracilariopsis chorda]|uniref:Uncharacterized protein n=1 Tax=Gracilariopsis chorda TaxID=448386 RepID=A0A2V3J273_9FLOR|nr:hypothetical protein BWQ96_01903 [Gracilariopsis chorda]|eukprot:PXF48443.1 hypothetical protein BWQ96_01903 [Gracilariopsis chorda]